MDMINKKRIFNEKQFIKSITLKLILYTISMYPFSVFADALAEWSTATTTLTASIRTFASQIILLCIVIAAGSAIVWVCSPALRNKLAWSWGVIAMIVVVYVGLSFYSVPLKNSFSAMLDPLRNLLPT